MTCVPLRWPLLARVAQWRRSGDARRTLRDNVRARRQMAMRLSVQNNVHH